MRCVLFLLSACLSGCANATPAAAILAADAASVVVFGRGALDLGVSAITGRDCSIVRLDRGQGYCAPNDAPREEAYCTRTLATVDCWAGSQVPAHPRPGIGDTPAATAAQLRWRAAPWPKSLTAE